MCENTYKYKNKYKKSLKYYNIINKNIKNERSKGIYINENNMFLE